MGLGLLLNSERRKALVLEAAQRSQSWLYRFRKSLIVPRKRRPGVRLPDRVEATGDQMDYAFSIEDSEMSTEEDDEEDDSISENLSLSMRRRSVRYVPRHN
eukprot:Plantae.Rhodophyta-Rhodochaete_pulchella.ctg11886.p2 GENE.Plantae.Rhodophyta-Rhodochaete_pulchella.ctg11886~~Plantae.Rhodophyta-Rhodochaete_pulchella.ctg11886.p2  ORF type:complete len:101 (-),score=15.53 Plantae.Rhodophyta-Rhodochaete_pulchella.ctg11886:47-349(-)